MYRIVALFSAVLLLALAGVAQAYTLKVTNEISQKDGVSVQGAYRGDFGLLGVIRPVMPGESWNRNIIGREAEDCFREIKITPLQKFPGCAELPQEVTTRGAWCENTSVKVKRNGCALAVEVERLVE